MVLKNWITNVGSVIFFVLLLQLKNFADELPLVLSGTQPLVSTSDLAAEMIEGIDRFLLKQNDETKLRREQWWKRDYTSPQSYTDSLTPNRRRLSEILGVRDARVPFDAFELIASTSQDACVGEQTQFNVYQIRWPVVRDVTSEGLLLLPNDGNLKGTVIYLPDADQTPQQACSNEEPWWITSPVRYAQAGYRVIIPRLISRRVVRHHERVSLTQREYLYRCSFELGRHIIGYEIQKVLACLDMIEKERKVGSNIGVESKIHVEGYNEGGLIALFSGAIDTRIDSVRVLGAFGSRSKMWQEGIDRNIFGLLKEFGDAELAAMIAPRSLRIDTTGYPELSFSGEGGGAPGYINASQVDLGEIERAQKLTQPLAIPEPWLEVTSSNAAGQRPPFDSPKWRYQIDAEEQEDRLVHQIDRDTQWLLRESSFTRADFMSKLDSSSSEAYAASVEVYRQIFRDEVIGRFDIPLKTIEAKSRRIYDEAGYVGYEVLLDVWDDVFAYGILLLPKDLRPHEKRPVVVCQHGLEGRPTDVIVGDHRAYHDFAAELCERGFIVFAPQNPYIGKDAFRTLQRKANPLGKTLFSIIVPQHQQIVNWLKGLPNVDAKRIAFYGLSYGGKSAMRIPPLVPDYCLSICSADFNEWVVKNASTRLPFSYVWTNEYEIFEWDLGSRFNYAEMAALIAPRPFMVERGHTDGVSTDEWVAFEFAKVFYLYSHRLKIPDLCEIEFFDGPHTINGKGTFDFLHKHLDWPSNK